MQNLIRSRHSVWLVFLLLCGAAIAQTPATSTLETEYNRALENETDLLAPRAWKQARKSYERAQKAVARNPQSSRSISKMQAALAELAVAEANAAQTRPQLETLLQQRAMAEAANSPVLAEKQWSEAEKQFRKLSSDIERGRLDDTIEQQDRSNDVLALYDAAELEALTNTMLVRARGAEALALVGNADKLASDTFALGEQAMQQSILSLQQNRYNNTNAEALANEAETEFKHATQITLVVQQVKNRDLSIEQLLLIWEARLLRINSAAGRKYDPLTGWDTTAIELADYISETNQRIANLQTLLSESRNYIASLEEELRIADERLGGTLAERDELIIVQEQQARSRERLMQVEQLFEPTEATVLREQKNIILRLNGLQFASGSSKLSDKAIELLGKVKLALDVYPDSIIMVEGHTDASGSAQLNARLSEDRANIVMRYMISDMKIEARRLSSAGFGSTRPIALNTSATGRAKNRRIDLVITPIPDKGKPQQP